MVYWVQLPGSAPRVSSPLLAHAKVSEPGQPVPRGGGVWILHGPSGPREGQALAWLLSEILSSEAEGENSSDAGGWASQFTEAVGWASEGSVTESQREWEGQRARHRDRGSETGGRERHKGDRFI